MERRTFLAAALAAPMAAGLSTTNTAAANPGVTGGPQRRPHIAWTIFSRHLQWVTTRDFAFANPYETGIQVGEAASEMGFSAVDLTVRDGGHVDPAMVATNLAPMVAGVRSTGVVCEQITTGISTLESPHAAAVLHAAAESGIRYYRWGTFSHDDNAFGPAVLAHLRNLRQQVRSLARLNRDLGLTAVYHTFSGGRVGSSVWDLLYLLEAFDPDQLAINFDIGHLTAEGAVGSWRNDLRAAMPWVRGVGLKDVTVVRNPNGSARATWVAAGEGMVELTTFFELLHAGGYSGPCEAQIEYVHNGVNLNQTFWADSASFTLTPDQMLATIANELAVYRAAATSAGWSKEEQA